MKTNALIAACALALATPAAATTVTLDFSGNICSGGSACGNSSLIDESYGDVPGQLDVVYNRDVNSTTSLSQLSWWNANYSDLQGVAYGGSSNTTGRPEIFLQPLAGFGVTLNSFQLGAWPNTNRTTQVSVLDGIGNSLFSSAAGIVIDGTTASLFSGPWTSNDGIGIQWGPNGFNVGIDNIEFEVFALTNTPPIPLPAAGWMLLTGLGGLVALRRRKTQG